MSLYQVNEKSMCIMINVPAEDISSWIALFKERYLDFLQRNDGFLVQFRNDDAKKATIISIFDNYSLKKSKKAVLTLSIFSTGTIMAQSQKCS